MKKSFLINIALLVFVNVLVKPFWIFGIDRSVQNITGTQEYGLYASLFSLSIIFNIFLDIGITNFNTRNIARHSHLLKKYVSNFVTLKLVLGGIYCVICILSGLVLGYTFKEFKLLFFLIFNQFLLSLILFFRSNLTGLHLFKTDSILSVIDRVLLIIICGILLLIPYTKNNFKIEWFIYSQTMSYLIATIIVIAVSVPYTGYIKIRYDKKILLLILKKSYPFALLVLLMGLYHRLDVVMLERMLENGTSEAGVYIQGFRIVEALTMFGVLFANILLPMFSRMLKQNEFMYDFLHNSFFLIIVPSITISISGFFYSNEIIHALYHNATKDSSEVFSILILSFNAYCTSYIFGTLLTSNNNMKLLNSMAIICVFINIIINFIFIPYFGSVGAAYSNIITQFISAIIQIVMAYRVFKFEVNIRKIAFFLLFIISIILLAKGV
ncbi:MAG: oligosaccharide flippase family protein, partial [Endomicrobiia bacterium]